MDKIYIQLSKLGDIINILPLACMASKTGVDNKVGIMASAEYADVLDGCSYVEKVVFDGKPWQVEKAVEQAKQLCPNVCVTMTNGPVKTIEKFAYEPAGQKGAKTDSFCRESWKLAGCLKEWGKIPLVFDQRDKQRESDLLGYFNLNKAGRKKKLLLISVGSPLSSSPFPYRNLLLELVTLKYGKEYRIINLADVKAHRFYDLLALYEMAHCLITVDTSHLHLAAAVPSLPVMALIQDKPIYWYGSAWRPQHHFFCRYRDFPWRALEMWTAIENIGINQRSDILFAYHGSVIKEIDGLGMRYFPIQYGSCRRDSANVLGDDAHFPMLQDVIRMVMQVAAPADFIFLTREDVKITEDLWIASAGNLLKTPSFAYRINRDKDGNDTFFPAVDLFAAPVDFWVKIFSSVPDIVMGLDGYWSRLLCEIFKKYGAVEIEGIFRNE